MAMPQNEAEWRAAMAAVTEAMQAYTAPFTTPLTKVRDESQGKLLGTGSYISVLGKRFLITNDHNLLRIEREAIAAMLHGAEDYYRVPVAVSFALPFDVGFALIPEHVWNSPELASHQAQTIPFSKLAPAHAPVENEVLFMKGYALQGSTFLFDRLLSNGTAYTTKEVPLPAWDREEKLEDLFHLAIDYRPDLASSVTPGALLPKPDGFSGSLVWNTHYVEATTQGHEWTADMAEVTGIIWGWPSSAACLIATRIEHVRSCLLQALEELRARGDI